MSASRTPLLALLRRAYQLAVAANRPHAAPADELIDQYADVLSRRHFLRSTTSVAATSVAATTLLGGSLTTLGGCSSADVAPTPPTGRSARLSQPRLAIIGAGMAGLHAAHVLSKAGFTNLTIYEAAPRTGGRIFTARNLLAPGLVTELGGEFIDSTHTDMLNLAAEFGLPLLDTQAPSETALIKDAYFFNGRLYSLADVVAAFRAIAPRLQADIDSLPDDIGYDTTDPTAVRLDRQSITQYLGSIGATGLIRALLLVAYETEFGRSCDDQSALNLLTLIATDTSNGEFAIFGDSDERYKIDGGNGRIIDKLTERYQSHIETGWTLRALNQRGSALELVFDGSRPIRADRVLMTLPFSILRTIDLNVPLSAVKRRAIQQLGYGTNAKLMLGFDGRPWRTLGYTGYYFTDNGAQSGWDNTQLQPGRAGGLTVYTGGLTGVNLGAGTAAYQASRYLPRLEQIYPGTATRYTGRAERFHWPSYRFSQGSYACYRVGQWTTLSGAEIETEGPVYFAGEHCSFDYQGYMNGAAETGRIAAEAILQTVLA